MGLASIDTNEFKPDFTRGASIRYTKQKVPMETVLQS